MHYKTCEVCGIKSGREKGEKRFFLAKFPLDEARCKQWVKVVGIEDLAYLPIEKLHSLKHVCGVHFKPRDFKKKKTQLKKHAVPSIGLIREPLADELLIGFPLHVAKQEANIESSSKILTEHNYSNISKSSISGEKRQHSPEPSTSKVYKKEKKNECDPSKCDKRDQGSGVSRCCKVFEEYLLPCLHRHDLCVYSKTVMIANIDFNWICNNHKTSIVDALTQRLSLLLIRNHCKIVNRSLAVPEESLADSMKRAEQQGMAK